MKISVSQDRHDMPSDNNFSPVSIEEQKNSDNHAIL